MKNCVSWVFTAGIVASLLGCSGAEPGRETASSSHALATCAEPALGEASVCDLGGGQLKYQVTLASKQAYVEVFSRQNGIQNLATNIVSSESAHADGTSTYSYVKSGYAKNDAVEYRFYSYLPRSPGVFTPGPVEAKWNQYTYGAEAASEISVPVLKDATLLSSSLCCGGDLKNNNYGSNNTVDAGTYHHTAKGLFGYALPKVSAAQIKKVELVAPKVSNPSAPSGTLNIQKVNTGLSTSWQESTVTWNNAPLAGAVGGTLTFPVTAGENRYDVTDFVKAELEQNQTEVSFLVTPGVGNTFIDSKENPAKTGTYLQFTYAAVEAPVLSGAWQFVSSDLQPSTSYKITGETIHLGFNGIYSWKGTWSGGYRGYTFERPVTLTQGSTYRLALQVSNTTNLIPVVLRASLSGAGAEQQKSIQGNGTIQMDFAVSSNPGATPVLAHTRCWVTSVPSRAPASQLKATTLVRH
jgi:hypothetical protein